MIEILQARSPSQAGCARTSSAVTLRPSVPRLGGGNATPRLSLGSGDRGRTTRHPNPPGAGGVGQAVSSAGATALLHPCWGVLPGRSRVMGAGQDPAAVPILYAVSLVSPVPSVGAQRRLVG